MPTNDPPITDTERATAIHCQRLICAAVDENNNKAWHGFVLADGTYAAEYGRVGQSMQTVRKDLSENASKAKVDKEVQKRLNYHGDKQPYVHQRTVGAGGGNASSGGGGNIGKSQVKQVAIKEINFGGNADLRNLISWLADVNVHTITANTNITYDTSTGSFSTPLGPVTQDAVDDARILLTDIRGFVRKNDFDSQKMKRTAADFIQIIPQATGMKRGWYEVLFANNAALDRQSDLLDSLEASIQQIVSDADDKTKTAAKAGPAVFDLKLVAVDDPKVIKFVKDKYSKERGRHGDVAHCKVKKVHAVEIGRTKKAFEAKGRKVGNIMKLWHGTKASNLLSILKRGLIIPKSASNGRMYGDGLYFSDQSTKSLRYATNAWSGGGNSDRLFMLICEVAMGKTHSPRGGWGSHYPVSGSDSTFAKAGSSVMNNEMIVYKTSQANPLYLVEFTTR